MTLKASAQDAELLAFAEQAATFLSAGQSSPPPRIRIQIDVFAVLRRVLVASGRDLDDLKDDWKPANAGIAEKVWGALLARFAVELKAANAAYSAYEHKPRFTQTTYPKALAAIDRYLYEKVCAALGITP